MSRYLALCATVDLGHADAERFAEGARRLLADLADDLGDGRLVDGHWTTDSATIADAMGVAYDEVEVVEVTP